MVCFLDQTLGWSLPVLSHPYMHSFLHRTLVVWLFAAGVMVAVSLLTKAPRQEMVEGNVFAISTDGNKGLSDYRTWAVVLFACTVVLWWAFR